MMKEVLQGNLSLRATIQRQSEQLDDRNAEIFQLSQENEDLRERLTVLEEYTGKDSLAEVQKLVREKRQLENRVKHLEQTSNNWTQF
jgi:chromosome segregation ATPase